MELDSAMKQNGTSNDETKSAPTESQVGLTVVVAFLDMMAREWAIEAGSESLHAAEEKLSELCAWIEARLPHLQPNKGALLALLAVRNGSGAEASRMRD